MQIVVFRLGEEHFAVETERVTGINDMMTVTRVPKAPSYIKGLINLRGSIKSLVDINLLLNLKDDTKQDDQTKDDKTTDETNINLENYNSFKTPKDGYYYIRLRENEIVYYPKQKDSK